MSKKISLIFCMIFLFAILPFISAVPSVTTVQQFTGGLAIKYPSDQILQQNMPYEFEAHVFNISNGMPMTSDIACYFHLYNSTGKHQLEIVDTTVSHNFDYSFDVSAGNFSEVGDYYYIIQCNNSYLGGFIEVPFEVTPNGLELSTSRAIVDIGLLLILIIFLIGAVILFMESENLLVRVGTLGLGYLLLIAINFIAWNMASDFILSAPFIASMFKIMFFVLIVGLFPLVLGLFIWYFLMLWKIKEIERLMTRGLDFNEASRRIKGGKR